MLSKDKTESAIVRIGKCVDSISDLLMAFDEDNGTSNYHTIASESKDLDLLLKELRTNVNPFMHTTNRRFREIKIPKTTLLQSLNPQKMQSWLNQKWSALLAGLL